MPSIQGRPRILLVDDEPDVLQSLGAVLAFDIPAAQVVTAVDGREALAMIERGPVQLVITDYRMPNVNGLDLVAEVHRRWPDCDTILMTAYPGEQVKADALERGKVKAFLTKPFAPEVVVDAAKRLLAGRSTA